MVKYHLSSGHKYPANISQSKGFPPCLDLIKEIHLLDETVDMWH